MNGVSIVRCDSRILPFADDSFDCCLTSPPYWNLRDYGLGLAGIGLEETLGGYLENLRLCFREVRRVLKPTGSLWLVIGDAHSTNGRKTNGTRVGYKQGTNRGSTDMQFLRAERQ